MLYALCFFAGTTLGTAWGYLQVRRATRNQRGYPLAKANILHLVETGRITSENGQTMLRQMGY